MKIIKFGGSSVADSARIKNVAQIIIEKAKKEKTGVVLSAMKGVTDLLIQSAKKAEKGSREYKKLDKEIKEKHYKVIEDLFPGEKKDIIKNQVCEMLLEIEDILHGIELVKECSVRSMDFIMSFGEKLSCWIMASYLNSLSQKAHYIDASKNLIITDNRHGSARVIFDQSYENISNQIKNLDGIPIITGFIASTNARLII